MAGAAGEQRGAARHGVRDMTLAFFDRRLLISGPITAPSSRPSPTLSLPAASATRSAKARAMLMRQYAVGGDAGLAAIPVFGGERALDREVEIGVFEHDQRRVAAKLHRAFLHIFRRLAQQDLADLGRAGEGHLAHGGIRANSSPMGAGFSAVTTLTTPSGTPARWASSTSARAENGVCSAGFSTIAQPALSAAPIAREHGGGEIPWRDRRDDADRLFERQQAAVGADDRQHVAINAPPLLGEPIDEGGAVEFRRAPRRAACPVRR